ncbi:MAG: isoleucine--tRNA ligase [Firmicutes bacterium]|nr:isoleucine--tRNA ligase [Bacillota bacterium]
MFNSVGALDVIPMEHKYLKWWEENQIFNKSREKNKDGPRWSFLDGPITANNPMGVHHAWGRTYKDIYQRYHAMNGFNMRYQNGFDCQGLWVEVEVEKELGFKSKRDIEDYGVEKFVQMCKDRVVKYSGIQTEQSKRLGYWMDWDNSYYTMSDENNYTIWHFLKKCHDHGWVYRGVDVMPWCWRCGTALSEHEIVTEGYKEITHKSVFLKFPLNGREKESLLVWTTTPWTLTSNVAAAVNPDLKYVKVRQDDEYFYLLETLTKILKGKYEIVETLSGKDMLGWGYSGPFDELPVQNGVEHKIIAWKEVTEKEGTGIVHIAPGCGKEDFGLSKEFGLSVIAPLDENGIYVEKFGWFTGKAAPEVADYVFESLEQKGRLYKLEDYLHRYPVCWRCGKELLFRLVDEWFINMDELRHQIMEVTKKIKWLPEFGMERELDWLRNMHDWCISKKRYWGLCLPIFYCRKCDHIHVVGSKEELKEKAVEGWEQFDGKSPHKPHVDNIKINCEKCGDKISRIPDVGNPWLDAGIVPFSTMHYLTDNEYWKQWYPADFITECFPGQFRNWFYSLLAMSTVLENHEPFRTILGHALVKDIHGEDMHKSKGNAIWFEIAAEKMGVELMRYVFAAQNPFNNLNFGYELGPEVYRKLLTWWNCYKFFVTYATVDGFDPTKVSMNHIEAPLMDRWLLSRLNTLINRCRNRMEEFDTAQVIRLLEEFIDDLSNWYIRTGRRRFWKSENDSDKTGAYLTLYWTLEAVNRLYAPILPFLSEEVYQNLVCQVDPSAPESVHLSAYPVADEDFILPELEAQMDHVMNVVRLGRNARNDAQLKVRQPLARLYVATKGKEEIRLNEDLIYLVKDELNIKEVVYVTQDSEDLICLKTKANLAIIGRKFRQDAVKIRAYLETLTSDHIREHILNKDEFVINCEGQEFTLTQEEVIIEKYSPEHLKVSEDDNWMVALDTRIDESLRKEGLVRELIHRIQDLRKEADYHVADRIVISYSKEGELASLMQEFAPHIKSEVLASELTEGMDGAANADLTKELSFDGHAITVALEKAKVPA